MFSYTHTIVSLSMLLPSCAVMIFHVIISLCMLLPYYAAMSLIVHMLLSSCTVIFVQMLLPSCAVIIFIMSLPMLLPSCAVTLIITSPMLMSSCSHVHASHIHCISHRIVLTSPLLCCYFCIERPYCPSLHTCDVLRSDSHICHPYHCRHCRHRFH